MQDALTGIPNRLAYEERLQQEFKRWNRFGTPLTFLIWDIDHFKQINDQYGHAMGDVVLHSIANQLARFQAGDSPQSVFDRADRALYQSKQAGRNRCTTC